MSGNYEGCDVCDEVCHASRDRCRVEVVRKRKYFPEKKTKRLLIY